MADMSEMSMPLPENTIAMMTGEGPFGSVEMGGMFSVLKVRKEQKPDDYSDPGWYKHPPGEVAFEWKGSMTEPARLQAKTGQSMPRAVKPAQEIEVQVRKPHSSAGHSGH